MPVSYPYIQYSGIWTTSQATDAVAAGTWAVPPTPKLFSWGQNDQGQLGLGNNTYYSSPKQVGSLTDWIQVSSSYQFSVAVKKDGTLWAWGGNTQGQLGLGNTTRYSSPKQVGSLTNWRTVCAGFRYVGAIKTDGTLWTWGQNNLGQLGLGNTTYYSSPKQVGSLNDWEKISTSGNQAFFLAIKTNGTLWSWGFNFEGELGLGNRTNYSSPKQVGSLTNWSYVANNLYCSYAVKTDGTLWSWGAAGLGGLGLGNTTYYSSPKQVGSLTTWSRPFAGSTQSAFVVRTNGALWTFGSNNYGQLGLGNTTSYSSPKQIGVLTDWDYVSCAAWNGTAQIVSCAIKTDGTLWSWGFNAAGQLGLGNTTNYSSPKQVGSLTNWTSVSAAPAFVSAILTT